MTALSPCGEKVRQGDPVRFRTALFARPEAREGLFALYAFNLEIAKIAPLVSDPMIGEIRLQWWRDSLDMIYGGGAVRRHEVVEPLCDVIRTAELPRAPFDALIDARASDLDPAFPSNAEQLRMYLRDTAGSLVLLAMRTLGGEGDDAARNAGEGIGIARYLAAVPILVAQGQRSLPGDIGWRSLRDGGGDDTFSTTVRSLAGHGQDAIARARQQRATVSRAAAPAFLEVPAANRALTAILQDASVLSRLDAGHLSPFQANLSTLWRGVTKRW